MVDRDARDKLAAALRAYMADEITAFEFDDRIFAIADGTKDRTVERVVLDLWGTYDDLVDHRVHASPPLWKYFQRVLLLLESDVEIEITRRYRWTARQPVALAGCMVFALTYARLGWSWQLLLLAPILGVADLLLSRWRERNDAPERVRIAQMTPFGALGDIRRARRGVPHFVPIPYRQELCERRIHSPQFDAIHGAIWRAIMLMLGPICLLTKMFVEQVEMKRATTV